MRRSPGPGGLSPSRGAVSDTASLRSAKCQECTFHLDEASLAVVADGARVRQILFNLLSNASKFTAEGGEIPLSAVRTRAPLRVPPDGPGDRRRVVTREVVWVSVAAQGSGLGFALCKKFVEMRGGTIGAESIPGRGWSFWFMLPPRVPCGGLERRGPPAHL